MDKETTEHFGKYSFSQSINNNNLPLKKGLQRREYLILISLSLGSFGAAIPSALQAPFYPQEAEKKGATPSEYGFVFAIYQLAIFLTSPFFGKCVTILGPKLLLNGGIMVLGICSILFGFLNKIDDRFMFLLMSNIVRALAGIGSSAYRTASFSIISSEFNENVAEYFGTVETFYGIGQIVGPAIGGLLFQAGGFSLPFIGSGVAILMCGVATYFLLPVTNLASSSKKESGNLTKFMCYPTTILCATMMGINSLCLGFNHVSLEPHLRQFNLSPMMLGTIFVVPGLSYAIAAPLWGRLCSKQYNPKYLGCISLIILSVCYFLIGPIPGIPIPTSVGLVVFCLFMFGLGGGGLRVVAFIDCLNDTLYVRNYPNNMVTYGLVSGLMTASISIGYFFGPTVGGILVEDLGFGYSTVLLLAVQLVLFLFLLFSIWKYPAKTSPTKDITEKTPLTGGLRSG